MSSSISIRLATALVSLGLIATLAGCGVGPIATSTTPVPLNMQGQVHGGEQAVQGASILLYTAGTGGNGTAATPLLKSGVTVTTDKNGFFTITGDYSCVNSTDQVYIVAKNGNPGLSTGSNPSLIMMAALGNCSNVPNLPYIYINELTTVAAAWTLAPFYSAYDHISASSTNLQGITNAMANANTLVNLTNGTLAVLPSTMKTEPDKIDALADALAVCENSDGSTACNPLFAAATPPSGTAPADTLTAAVNIIRNPGNKVSDVFNTIGTFTPFATAYTGPPNDWTLSMTISGNGLYDPTALAVDAGGNVWTANYYGPLSAFTPNGTAIGNYAFPYSGPESFGLVIKTSDQIWATLEEAPSHYPTRGSVAVWNGALSGTTGQYLADGSDISIEFPVALSTDPYGNLFIANYGNSTATVLAVNGQPYTTLNGVPYSTAGVGTSNVAFPVAIAADATGTATVPGGFWLANQGDSTVTHLTANGTLLARPTCCDGANGIATDALGNVWVSSYYSSSASEISAAGTVTLNSVTGGGLSYPAGVVIDGAQDVWIANYRGQSFTHLAGSTNLKYAAGTGISPATGLGLDASLLLPFGIAVDASGNVWISNFANNDLVMFYGIATPVKTPVMPIPVAP